MFREIRGIQQRDPSVRRRWFQDPHFDLFVSQNFLGRPQWFQLCYRRDTPAERVLEWKRGRGFQHMKVRQPRYAADRESGELITDGALPYLDVIQAFRQSAASLPLAVADFVTEKIRQHQRPAYRRKGSVTPGWLERLHKRRL